MKQVIAVRTDVGMSDGKLVAQACHASVGAYRNAESSVRNRWEADGAKKVAVTIGGEEAAMELFRDAQAHGLAGYVVKDAGETELEPGTVTAVGVGPGEDGDVDAVTGRLDLL